MKVLILLRILWTAGAQRIAVNEYRHLEKLGYDPKIVFLRAHTAKGYEDLLKGVNYEVVRESGEGLLTPLFGLVTRLFSPDRGLESTVDLDLIRKFPDTIEKNKPDYIICHDQWAGLGGYYAKKKLDVPYSVFIHERLSNYGVPLLGGLATHYEHISLTNALRVFAVTRKVADTVDRKYGVKAYVNYPGMDKTGSSSTPYEEKENTLLSVSFWDRGRSVERYLEIISELEDYRLLLVGNWRIAGYKAQTLDKIKDMGLQQRIALREGVSEGELLNLYQKSKFLLRFGFGEYGLATAVIEAMQNTLPVIINDELGISDLIREYGAGAVLSGTGASEVKGAIRAFDNLKSYKILQANIERLREIYSWKAHVIKLLSPLEQQNRI